MNTPAPPTVTEERPLRPAGRLPDPLPGGSPRLAALDVARAFAVVAMVLGHTFDALLAPAVRAEPLVALYWTARGFTAPLFMLVSGWAVTVATARRGEVGLDAVRARLPRVALLLGLGYALRWPGWGVPLLAAGDGAVWAHFLAFDALHAIAVALLATAVVLALPLRAPARAAILVALAAGAVALGTSPLVPPDFASLPPSIPMLALAQAAGGTSAFPLFPWVGYFFVGAVLGLAAGRGEGWRAAVVAPAGAGLVAAGILGGIGASPGDPSLFAVRAGVVLLFLALLSLVPASLAARVRPLGRASLAIYVIHLPIVYGWSTHTGLFQRVGPRLSFGAALGAGLAVLAASLLVRRVAQRVRERARLAAALAAGSPAAATRGVLRWTL